MAIHLVEADLNNTIAVLQKHRGNRLKAANELKITVRQLRRRIRQIEETGGYKKKMRGLTEYQEPPKVESPFPIEHPPEVGAQAWEIKSLPGNIFRFGAFGDLHAGSKYCRWDVRADLHRRAEKFGAQAILDTGNWCEGEASFNRYDLEKAGMDEQMVLLAEKYPKTTLPTYAITADDHEGWWIRREGIDVGRHCQMIMREAGHHWTDLGYLESDIILRNSDSGAVSVLRLMHPKRGSAYALSYAPQKLIEVLEGGEKPAVLLIGHFHKLENGNVRNIWYVQTGCQVDQGPFSRGKALENHVGGTLIELEQDPETGAIVRMKTDMLRYFVKSYYVKTGRAGGRWSGHGPIRPVPRELNSVD